MKNHEWNTQGRVRTTPPPAAGLAGLAAARREDHEAAGLAGARDGLDVPGPGGEPRPELAGRGVAVEVPPAVLLRPPDEVAARLGSYPIVTSQYISTALYQISYHSQSLFS